tara:strand:- start:636 stop:785 length:150 start_codon:yes stop_codon:yes gene_type:complete
MIKLDEDQKSARKLMILVKQSEKGRLLKGTLVSKNQKKYFLKMTLNKHI